MWKEMQRLEKVAETEGGDVRELGEMEQAAKTEALQAGICPKELLKQKDLCWLFKNTSEKP